MVVQTQVVVENFVNMTSMTTIADKNRTSSHCWDKYGKPEWAQAMTSNSTSYGSTGFTSIATLATTLAAPAYL